MSDRSRTATLHWLVGVELGLLGVVGQQSQAHIPDDAEYVTSKICGMCHKAEATAWATTAHARTTPPDGCTEPWKYVTGYDPASDEGKEPGVACEMCHGCGSVHVKSAAAERKTTIISGAKLETPSQKVSICAQCHARYTLAAGEPPASFTPGDDLLAKITLLPPEPGQKMQQVNELVHSKHFEKGTVCMTRHTAHPETGTGPQLRKPVNDLCGECHKDQLDLAHTKGRAKPGDTCVTCHMPGGSHPFQKPATP